MRKGTVMKRVRQYSEQNLFRLIDVLYSTAGDMSKFSNFLYELGKISDSRIVVLRETDHCKHTDSVVMASKADNDPGLEEATMYNQHYGQLQNDPWIRLKIRRALNPGPAYVSTDVIGDNVFKNTEFYNDFLRPRGWFCNLNMSFLQKGSSVFSLCTLRSSKELCYGPEDIKLFEALWPHINRVYELNAQLASLNAYKSALEDVIDRLPMGVLLVDSKAKVYAKNTAASEILDARDGFGLDREGQVITANHSITTQLRQLVFSSVCTGHLKSTSSGGTLLVPRSTNKRGYNLLVTPLKTSTFCNVEQQPYAAVFISDHEKQIEASEETLCSIFNLSPAEVRIAVRLCKGLELEEISDELRLSKNTVKTHAKSVYKKTGTNRKDGLVRLLMGSVASLKNTKRSR